ncbi:MAG: cation diffusion facilitator family transporter [Termitinemataceae bacterium]|nr:MAG: cation diffusion facilitator family transporter [Termitinemataceae bacterium]
MKNGSKRSSAMSENNGECPNETGERTRSSIIKKASVIALCGNALLAILKIVAGIAGGSLAVIGDGIDSSVDVLISAMTIFVAGIISRPADEDHPWGHGRAETIGTAAISFLLVFAGVQLVINSAQNLITAKTYELPQFVTLIATLISITGKLLLALNQYQMGKKSGSAILIANSKNMAADVFISAGVFAGLGCSILFNFGALDSIVALLVGLWVIKSGVSIFLDVNSELMDGGSMPDQYKAVFDAVNSVTGAGHPHKTRMRRIAGFWDIDLDIEVDGNLSVTQAHNIATEVEAAIRNRLDLVYDIMVHIEPSGCENHRDEAFGLSEDSVNVNREF